VLAFCFARGVFLSGFRVVTLVVWRSHVTTESHYSLSLRNHVTGAALKVERVDLPFGARSYRLRVNGRWAEKIPVGSKSAVWAQARKEWVAHQAHNASFWSVPTSVRSKTIRFETARRRHARKRFVLEGPDVRGCENSSFWDTATSGRGKTVRFGAAQRP